MVRVTSSAAVGCYRGTLTLCGPTFSERLPRRNHGRPPSPRFSLYATTVSVSGVPKSFDDHAPGHGTYPPGLCSIALPAASTLEQLHGESGWLLLRALPPIHAHTQLQLPHGQMLATSPQRAYTPTQLRP